MHSGADNDDTLVTEVCWHYYVNELTQAEVAKVMGLTRLRVNQAIGRAKALGMVRVEITSPFLPRVELQDKLQRELSIGKALVVPANRGAYDYHVPAGAALASYLLSRLESKSWRKVGVSWGMTLASAIERLPRQARPDLDIVSLIGGTTAGAAFNAFGIASGFAEKLGASYSLLAAPIYLPAEVDRDVFLSLAAFTTHLTKCRQLEAALLVAGDLSRRSFMISSGLPRDVSAKNLAAAGAVGDVLGRFLDKDGATIDHPLNDRTVGVDLDVLASIPEKILAAAGPHKVKIIRAAARRGLVDVLITDDLTAELLTKGRE